VRFNNKIHAKVYVGNKYALIGSANLTASAFKGYNYECLMLLSKAEDSVVFEKVRNYAEKYFVNAILEEECEKRFLNELKRLGLHFNSLSEVKAGLESMAYELSA